MLWSDKISKRWLRHYEIEKDEVRIYRPSYYKFPFFRGREGFEIKNNGEFISYDIAPACGIEQVSGRWEVIEQNKIKVTFFDQPKKNHLLNIISCEDGILKIKREK
jgi:hypothetical protein